MVPRNVVSVPRLSFYLHFRLHNSVRLCNRVLRWPLVLLCDPTRIRARRTTTIQMSAYRILIQSSICGGWEQDMAGSGGGGWCLVCLVDRYIKLAQRRRHPLCLFTFWSPGDAMV